MPPVKADPYREHRNEYAARRQPALVTVGAGRYLTATGTGDPNGKEFAEKLGALYGAAYTVKFAGKKASGRDFKVGAVEALWWSAVRGRRAPTAPRRSWRWKLLLRVPDFVTEDDLAAARRELKAKARPTAGIRLETIEEGPCVQVLHVGPYVKEPATLAAMDDFAREHGLRFRGRHHEIYLSDPRRVPAARLRTLLRHPVVAART